MLHGVAVDEPGFCLFEGEGAGHGKPIPLAIVRARLIIGEHTLAGVLAVLVDVRGEVAISECVEVAGVLGDGDGPGVG